MMRHSIAASICVVILAGCARVPFEALGYAETESELPQFVGTHFVDLSQIEAMTLFRSGYGHDYSDRYESQRSMKHYFKPIEAHQNTNDSLPISSPVDGTITMVMNERDTGAQIRIISSEHTSVVFVFFHIVTTVAPGDTVEAGDPIGTPYLINDSPDGSSDFDVAVWLGGDTLISYVDLVNDTIWGDFQARFGVSERSDLSFTEAFRDANPVQEWSTGQEDWIYAP